MTDPRLPVVIHEHGDPAKPTLLLLHGLTEAGTTWPDAICRWQDDWFIRAVDLRGHGDSPRFTPDELPSAPTVLLDDILEILDGSPGPVGLIGHSLGGYLALRAALARPERVWALILEDPSGPPPANQVLDPAFITEQERFLDVMAMTNAGERERMRRESSWSAAEIDAWAACKPQVDRAYIRSGRYLDPFDALDDAENLSTPTLVIAPAGGMVAGLASTIRNHRVRVVQVPGAGHCVRRDRPEAFHAAADPFLTEHAQLSKRAGSPDPTRTTSGAPEE